MGALNTTGLTVSYGRYQILRAKVDGVYTTGAVPGDLYVLAGTITISNDNGGTNKSFKVFLYFSPSNFNASRNYDITDGINPNNIPNSDKGKFSFSANSVSNISIAASLFGGRYN